MKQQHSCVVGPNGTGGAGGLSCPSLSTLVQRTCSSASSCSSPLSPTHPGTTHTVRCGLWRHSAATPPNSTPGGSVTYRPRPTPSSFPCCWTARTVPNSYQRTKQRPATPPPRSSSSTYDDADAHRSRWPRSSVHSTLAYLPQPCIEHAPRLSNIDTQDPRLQKHRGTHPLQSADMSEGVLASSRAHPSTELTNKNFNQLTTRLRGTRHSNVTAPWVKANDHNGRAVLSSSPSRSKGTVSSNRYGSVKFAAMVSHVGSRPVGGAVCKSPNRCEQTEVAMYEASPLATPSTAATSASSSRVCSTTTSVTTSGSSSTMSSHALYYKGPDPAPPLTHTRLYDSQGPVAFSTPPTEGGRHPRAELRSWMTRQDVIISQNSSKRKVHRGLWLSPLEPDVSFPVAIKFVEDCNARDGRSIKREIECHLFIQQRLHQIQKDAGYSRLEDAWPSAELFGYHLDKKNPGRCALITRKLSGPDFFDVIRQEHNSATHINLAYEYHKLHWCTLALKRVQQYARLGIRHNDVKPDNIVLDFYFSPGGYRALDVKIIDLGTASMQEAKEFTGGTSWYESPEQKVLEYHSKKQRDPVAAKRVDIGLTSDVWAAGLSITEVLVGRRVVDSLKLPHGPGPLDYRGPVEGWALSPDEWVERARRALLYAPRDMCKYTFCFESAKYIFDRLVRPVAAERGTLQEAIDKMKEQTEKALEHSRRAAAVTHTAQQRVGTPPTMSTSHTGSIPSPSSANSVHAPPASVQHSHQYSYHSHHYQHLRKKNGAQSTHSS